MIRTLLALGADPNATDESGVSAIHIVAEYYGELNLVRYLITNDQSAPTDSRQQALNLCAAAGREETWREITGLDLHQTNDTFSPSYLVARGQYLLNAPCNIIPGIFELAYNMEVPLLHASNRVQWLLTTSCQVAVVPGPIEVG